MINAINLLWIIPAAFIGGFILCAFLCANK